MSELGHLEGSCEATDAAVGELDHAVYQGEKRVIFAHADVLSGADFAPTLTHQDAARADNFSGVFFHA